MEDRSSRDLHGNTLIPLHVYKARILKVWSTHPQGPPKTLSGDKVGVSQGLRDLEHHARRNAKAMRKTHLFSVEPDIKEIGGEEKKRKEMPFFPRIFLDLENRYFS